MLDIWTINVVTPTTGNDRYERVAINETPIVILGRESQVKKTLNKEFKDFIKDRIVNQELWDQTVYCVRHLYRAEGFWESENFEWKASEYTELVFTEE